LLGDRRQITAKNPDGEQADGSGLGHSILIGIRTVMSAVITKDEVAIAIMGHRRIGTDSTGTPVAGANRMQAHGDLRARNRISEYVNKANDHTGQTPGSGLWHVNGSADGRWAVGDDFSRGIYLIDRHTRK
jgi:oligogalacturonide lyase